MTTISVFSKIPNLSKELKLLLPTAHFHEVLSDKDETLVNSEIIIADFNLLAPHLYNLPNTKWVQGTWAGVDKILPFIRSDDKPLPFTITRFSGQHFGRIMAEYVIHCIVDHERQFEQMRANQRSKVWLQDGKISQYRTISDLNVGILGIGQIGGWIGRMLGKFGANVFGFGRRPTLDLNKNKYLSNYYTKEKLPEFLGNCDYIVNVLPDTSETRGLLNKGVLANCKERRSVFINIGRASIVADCDLIESINKGWLSALVLDVFNEEPLPKDSPLWSMPQVKITPHVAGSSRAKDIAQQFCENLQLYTNNKQIPTQLDTRRQY